MKQYHAVLFDLFGTVALFRQSQLPLFEWGGETTRSTMGELRTVITQKVPAVAFADFFATLSEVGRELGEVRAREMREFPSAHRFALTLRRVGLVDSAQTVRLAEELSLAHMALLARATEIPDTHLALLEQAHQRYRVALVSNFDHGPTARQILRRGGAAAYFHHVVISDEHGLRKPHPRIFTDTLAALGVRPQDALFVGDSLHDDVVGARQVGLDVAWVNAARADLPAGIPPPDYVVRDIPELRAILFR